MALSPSEAARLLSTPDGIAVQDAVRRALYVERFRNGRIRDVDSLLRGVSEQLRVAVRGRLERMASRGAAALELRSAALMEARIAQILRDALPRILDLLAPALRELATSQGARIGVLGARALGTTVRQHLAGWSAATSRGARAAVARGVADGEKVSEIMSRLDEALSRARVQAATLVRTTSDAVAVQARERQIERDGFELIRYVAVLDDRTTEICEELNGTVWPVGEGPRPPQHYGCRSFIAPAESDADAKDFGDLTLDQVEEAA